MNPEQPGVVRRYQLIASGETVPAKVQITHACSDCPMARCALSGWLGGATPEEYIALAHSDAIVPCHVYGNVQCAGMAIYRRNVCKRIELPGLVLERDPVKVFSTPMQFLAYHRGEGNVELTGLPK